MRVQQNYKTEKQGVFMKFAVLFLLFAGSVQAATIGQSSFTVWLSSGTASVDIRETDKGEVLGQSAFGTMGIINLKNNNGGLKGFSDDGFTDIHCSSTQCTGQVGSGSVNIQVTDHGQRLEGSLNHVYIRAKIAGDKIQIQADGSLELTQTKPGSYAGSCMVESMSISQASLKTSGTLVDRIKNDPAFFIVYLVSPLVRNGI